MSKLLSILLAVIIFLAPTNLFLVLSEKSSFVNGLQIDYLIPKLYAVTLPIVLFTVLYFIWQNKLPLSLKEIPEKIRTKPIIFLTVLLSLLTIIVSIFNAPISGGWYVLNFLIVVLFGFAAYRFLSKNESSLKIIIWAVILTILFQAGVGIYQFAMQQSLSSYLLLGEPNIATFIGLAKISIQGRELVLPYGTTAHPNVLGGFLSVYLLSIWHIFFNSQSWIKNRAETFFIFAASIIGMIALILTFSLTAWLSLVLGTLILAANKIPKLAAVINQKTALLLGIAIIVVAPIGLQLFQLESLPISVDENSIFRRNYLNNGAVQMTAKHPIFGVGLNSFTKRIEGFSPEREVVRFVQPVHHIGLLWLAETGIIGIALFGLIFRLIHQAGQLKKLVFWLLIFSPIMALDHYLLSLVPGMMLTAIFYGIFLQRI